MSALRDMVASMVHAFDDQERKDAVRALARDVGAMEARVAELEARCKRLEEAGDAMAEWNLNDRNLGCDPELAHRWQQAKESKP